MDEAFEKYNNFQTRFYKGIQDLIETKEVKLRKELDKKIAILQNSVDVNRDEFDSVLDTLGGDPAGRKNQMLGDIESLNDRLQEQEVLIKYMQKANMETKSSMQSKIQDLCAVDIAI